MNSKVKKSTLSLKRDYIKYLELKKNISVIRNIHKRIK